MRKGLKIYWQSGSERHKESRFIWWIWFVFKYLIQKILQMLMHHHLKKCQESLMAERVCLFLMHFKFTQQWGEDAIFRCHQECRFIWLTWFVFEYSIQNKSLAARHKRWLAICKGWNMITDFVFYAFFV